MGFWPFGREPADVELASRVVTVRLMDGFTVRGKLTLHYLDPQTQVADILMTVSVGSRIFGAPRSSKRTSPGA
jgi:hypothetical protein